MENIKMRGRLKAALRRIFPEEDLDTIAEILSLAARRGSINYEEIKVDDHAKVDTLLLLYEERLLIPSGTSRSLAWEDRVMELKPGEVYEMPHVIRNLIKRAEETGRWDPNYAVRRYLEDVGENDAERMLELFNNVKDRALGRRITPEQLLEAAERLNLESKIGKIISELKGGGIISPCLRNPLKLQYEINPSLTG